MVSNIDNGFVIEQIRTIAKVEPELVEDYDLLKLDEKNRLQVRIDRNNAPKEMVDRFRFQMSESKFPPIVVTADHRIIDGNTRFAAHLARDEIKVTVLLVPLSWDDADHEGRERLLLLGLALNNVNGKPLDESERMEMIRHALNVGLTNAQIMYQIGIGEKVIRSLRAEMEAKHRLNEIGRPADDLAPAIVRALGKSEITSLDDDSYKALADLAHDAQLHAHEVKSLAASVQDLTSVESRQERLTRERDAQAQRIAAVKKGGNGHPPYARQLRRQLALLTDSNHPADAFVERNKEDMSEHLRILQIAIATLQRVLELQADEMPVAEAA
jgi:hypothetical protein